MMFIIPIMFDDRGIFIQEDDCSDSFIIRQMFAAISGMQQICKQVCTREEFLIVEPFE